MVHTCTQKSMHVLYLVVDNEMMAPYRQRIANHRGSESGADSGFDLLCKPCCVQKAASLYFGVKCAAFDEQDGVKTPAAFFLVPRSSISNTTLRMQNSIGIIDAGYRGALIAKVDNIGDEDVQVLDGQRLFQIVMPDLKPFDVRLTLQLDDTERGDGGFGSTGK